MEQSSFGQWLRLRRKALDLTREVLAERVGCSTATIRKLESEERRPSELMAERLADVLGVPAAERIAFLRFARLGVGFPFGPPLTQQPWQPAVPHPRPNLPTPTTSLVGRQQELAELQSYWADPGIRLVTLTGPPGIGKTRLALEAGRAAVPEFLDGIVFCALAPLENPLQVAISIALALGFGDPGSLTVREQLKAGIADKRMLLILDNAEHLIDEVAGLVFELLTACSQLKILVTSREALRVNGEWVLNVAPLAFPVEGVNLTLDSIPIYPALGLFSERARAARSDFMLTSENLPAIAGMCSRLDGLPLAIELIAARVRMTSPQALLQRLDDQLVLNADGRRAVSPHQRTLREAIGWSYDYLSPEEQTLFANLAVFSGGFNLPAAQVVAGNDHPADRVVDLLNSLADKSLVQRTIGESGETRFNLLVTIQGFALKILRDRGDEEHLRAAHLAYFVDFAEEGDRNFHSRSQLEWIDRLEAENDNFHAALEWGLAHQQTSSVLRLLNALGWSWEVRGHYSEAHCWLDEIRAMPDLCDYPLIYARLLNHIGRHSWTQEKHDEARRMLEESQQIGLSAGEDGELCLAETLNWLGLVTLYPGRDRVAAREIFELGLRLNQKWGDRQGIALSTFHLGILEADLGNDLQAQTLYENSLAEFQSFGDNFFIARVSSFLGSLFQQRGDLDLAGDYFEQQLNLDTLLQFWDGIADGWSNLGRLARARGAEGQALEYFEQSQAVIRAHGLRR